MNRTSRYVTVLALGMLAVGACAIQDDILRTSCATDGDCNLRRGEKCEPTESGLACVASGLPPPPETDGGVNPNAPTWHADIAPIMEESCVDCHSPPSFISGVKSFRLDQYADDDAGVRGGFSLRGKILDRCVTLVDEGEVLGVMPPLPEKPLPKNERDLISEWVAAGGPEGVPDGGPAETVGFKADILPIFRSACLGCHGADKDGNLDLRDTAAWSQLVGVNAACGSKRVLAGDPQKSALWIKTGGTSGCGGPMPQTRALKLTSRADFQKIETWIREGALDN